MLDLNAMVDARVEAGSRALGSLLQGAQSVVGVMSGRTFKKLYNSVVQSVLLYEAEAWGCLRCLKPLEQVQPSLPVLYTEFPGPTLGHHSL